MAKKKIQKWPSQSPELAVMFKGQLLFNTGDLSIG